MKETYHQSVMLSVSALVIIFGMLASGPLGSMIVQALAPQPAWQGADLFIRHYSNIQVLPFVFGFFLLFGFILFFASLPMFENDKEYIWKNLFLLFAGVYAFMISLNYLIQIAVIPNVLKNKDIIELFSSQNPRSFFWYLEMTGYGFLGLATFAAAFLFGGNKKKIAIKILLILNGIISVAGALLTFIFKGWVMTPAGLISYLLWNLLCLAVMIIIIIEYRFGKRFEVSR